MSKKLSGAKQRKRKALQAKDAKKSSKLLQAWCEQAFTEYQQEHVNQVNDNNEKIEVEPSNSSLRSET